MASPAFKAIYRAALQQVARKMALIYRKSYMGPAPIDSGFPGQPSNPVGYNNTPASVVAGGWPGTFLNGTNTALGNYTSLANPVAIGDGTGGTLLLQNNTTYYFLDITPTPASQLSCNAITDSGRPGNVGVPGGPVHDITFVGCRFTANATNGNGVTIFGPDACVDCYTATGGGSYNITFSYCTMAPLPSVITHPIPATAWPSSSVGTGTVFVTTGPSGNTYQMPYPNNFQYGIAVFAPSGKFITIDHCDMWGWGDGVGTVGPSWASLNTYPDSGQINITDNWIHDARTDNANADHTNGVVPSNANFPVGFSNCLMRHNTISALGNTNALAFQHILSAPGCWSAATNYTNGGAPVGAADGFAYSPIANSGPGFGGALNPTGNANTGAWTQNGINSYRNIQIINNHLSGFANMLDFGAGTQGSTGMIFTDNIISNYVMYKLSILYDGTGSYNGPLVPNFANLFNGTNSCSWLRNTYQMYPGTGTGGLWDTTVPSSNNGKFFLPDYSWSTSDWHN